MPREDWPKIPRAGGCGCTQRRTTDPLVDSIADQSLSAALRHAQDRWDRTDEFERLADEYAAALLAEADMLQDRASYPGEAVARRRSKLSGARGAKAAAAARRKPPSGTPRPGKVTIPAVDVSLGSAISLAKLNELRDAKRKGGPLIAPGWHRDDKGLYVITAPGLFDRPLYVGEVRPEKKGSLLHRLDAHIRGYAHKRGGDKVSPELKKLHDLLNGRPVDLNGRKGIRAKPDDIFIQPAKIATKPAFPIDFSTDPNHHGAELLLKGLLDPILGKGSLTFEYEAEDEEADLQSDEIDRVTATVLRSLRSVAAPRESVP